MAPLKIIGAGFGRTGTLSLCYALDMLGYNCHHMEKLILDPSQDPEAFEAAYHTRTADWDKIFANYDAAVDWPSAEFWPELLKQYPDAKVILTVRDPNDWYASVGKTIKEWPMDSTIRWPERMLKTRAMARVIVKEGALKDYTDKNLMISKFKENIERAKATVPDNQLLIFRPSEGWGPLCRFLGIPEPEAEFPRCNRREDFVDRLRWVRESLENGKFLSAMPYRGDIINVSSN
ncbi:hypothetical protein N5P37_003350 [Trichoderma harzianum]|uniref:Sulfotransferase domain-containing protein n=1 Tax=Trichoderma harzianum CBS 226.95 TaxID=983964 RepID=A0A2T4AU55_TRIHA|nr:hypothetical protein M431DRAFT_502727 [Trichoderma harzianum CBS 226.95]KAK0763959.1 hypothetical protein N5P37_003350 [Trichoderma harzianum]PTB60593.1 hypothetical protein M431DRAFT_502727 [Trichoderma harzianum CBS 226.95]